MELIQSAQQGNINDFQKLFAEFQAPLKSYLYRLLLDRNDAEDLTHDTFVKAFDKIKTFKAQSSLKTWVFQIGTNLAYDYLRKYKRWQPDVKEKAKELALTTPAVFKSIVQVATQSGENAYDMREHINSCFTCMAKTLLIEQQIALILKDIYDFSIADIALILEKTEGVSKHLLLDARKTMTDIFEHRCALINKKGVCNQCSELNGIFNPKQNQQEALMKLELVKESVRYNREELYEVRPKLISVLDPLRSVGADWQDIIIRCDRMAAGEVTSMH